MRRAVQDFTARLLASVLPQLHCLLLLVERLARRRRHSFPDICRTSTPAICKLQQCVSALQLKIQCGIREERLRAPPEHENGARHGTTLPLVRAAPVDLTRRAE